MMEKTIKEIKKKLTIDVMKRALKYADSYKEFKKNRKIIVNDKMQKYTYILSENPNQNFRTDFKPYFTPKQMIELGIFEGKYLNDCILEFPKDWFFKPILNGKLSPEYPNPSVNYFKIKSRLSLQEWKNRKWIPCHEKDKDIRGWFQWYCRYWIGRRIPEVDNIQIGRWKKFKRHYVQVEKNAKNQICSRQRQRQALLQWSWNCFV